MRELTGAAQRRYVAAALKWLAEWDQYVNVTPALVAAGALAPRGETTQDGGAR